MIHADQITWEDQLVFWNTLSWLSSAYISFKHSLCFSNDMHFLQICVFINDSASSVPKGDNIAYYIMTLLLFRAKYFIFSFSHSEV